MAPVQVAASKYINEWVFDYSSSDSNEIDSFLPSKNNKSERVVVELHSHSKRSDGCLSPAAVVERAHRNGVKVLALTDHDTMAGIPEAMNIANKHGIKLIPGVEISSMYSSRDEPGHEESVHILAYYGGCGPAKHEELDIVLSNIRDGRHVRAKNMLLKLNALNKPIKWENVCKIAGDGVAPGRVHVARALVEAGHVESIKDAFSKYLYDGGPAYATGTEPAAEEAVKLIRRTGGIAALAHPWTLKHPIPIIRSLKSVGLHAMEVYRSDGKVSGFDDLANKYNLIKIGGSDYHGRGGHSESDLGSVVLPVLVVHEFLKLARPIWLEAAKDLILHFTKEPSESNLEKITMFGMPKNLKGCPSNYSDIVDICLSSWLTTEERRDIEFQNIKIKISDMSLTAKM